MNQGSCDLQSVGTCAGGGGTECTSVANGPAFTCTGTNDDGNNACAWTSTNVCTYSSNAQVLQVSVDGSSTLQASNT